MATAIDAARWIAIESDDYDGVGGAKGYGWARASTEDVARGLRVAPEAAFRLLKAAKKNKLVTQVEGMRKTLGSESGRHREHEVGWALWEVHLDRTQTIERDGSARPQNEKAIAFHWHDPALDDIARGDQVTGRMLLSAAESASIEVDPKLKNLLKKSSVWIRPGISNISNDAANQEAIVLYRAIRDQSLKPNGAAYYVWVLAPRSDMPLSSEGPYGPHPLRTAEQMARIGASEGVHDRAVSLGRDPEARGFKIVRRYAARTRERLV